jgi:hypothetical protein
LRCDTTLISFIGDDPRPLGSIGATLSALSKTALHTAGLPF